MLEQVLTNIHNWFQVGVYPGTYTIEDGEIALPFLKNGQYFRIVGSIFNNGLHQYGPEMKVLQDETFTGSVWALAVPRAVVELADEIATWQKKFGDAAASPYTSESKADYSYSKPDMASSGGWETVFRAQLNQWRKVSNI